MKKEKRENPLCEEFIEGLLGAEASNEVIGDDELFGKGVVEHEEPEENPEKENEHALDILEHGRNIKVPAEAVGAFAKGMGKTPGEIIDIYQKGCCFDALMKRYLAAKGDTDAFEKIAGIRGIGKDELKAEIIGVLENAKMEKAIREIEEANPGMNRETAEELAKFRLAVKKPKERAENPENKKIREKLREIDAFMAKHSGEGIETLDNSVIEEWEGGVPLESAFGRYLLLMENKKLLGEMENLKNRMARDDQKNYAREHSSGSAASAAGKVKLDEFIEGLFKEY